MGVRSSAGQSSFAERHAGKRWDAWVRSEVGAVRRRLEDSWMVGEARMAGEAWDAHAVFDGLGGSPNGQEAAWAAAKGLARAMARATGPRNVLRELDADVLATGGASTAAVLLSAQARPGECWLLGAGDSSVHVLATPGSLLPHDRAGLHAVTDCLGMPLRRGHALRLRVGPGKALLLCTDGVDQVAGLDAVRECLAAPAAQSEAALDRLLACVEARGSPDNATALLVRRL
ncbi:MAG: Protein phosphatase [Thermoplasmata archaeon]|jgi:serine/threonine protein phosphatase PrpC|nr:Protein phosphatase [Thermoplasmata archaeon]